MTGRPPIYDTPEQFLEAVLKYIESVPKKQWTITGLALALGFESRQSFYDYEEREGFSYIVKSARLHIENAYEEKLSDGSPTGAIFALKNMGWKDSQEVKHSGGTENKNEISISDLPDELARQILANRTKEA